MRIPGLGLILLLKEQRIWRKNNRNNYTRIARLGSSRNLSVGKGTYGPIAVINSSDAGHLRIGNYCSIADGVTFILSGEHRMDCLSTYPYKARICHIGSEASTKGDIIVSDDVWIGYGATILSGVNIGQGAVIAAGSVVTTDVKPYTIVAGIPAREIKKRFSDEIIKELMDVDFASFDEVFIKKNIDALYTPINRPDDVQKWKQGKDK